MTRKWSGKSRGGAFGHWFFIKLIKNCGIKSAYFFLALVVIYFIPFAPKSTRAIWYYNRCILKYGRLKSILKLYVHYFTFGQSIIDRVCAKNGLSDRFSYSFGKKDEVIKILENKPAILISAHVGAWEMGTPFFGNVADKINVVMLDNEHKAIKKVHKEEKQGVKIIAINENNLDSIMKIKKALDKKEAVCFLADRFLNAKSSVKVKFFGAETYFAKGPFVLAQKFKVPVVFYFAMRENGMKYNFIFKVVNENLSWEDFLKIYVEELEKILKKYPQQWYNFYNLWETKENV